MVGLVPVTAAAVCVFLFAAYMFMTGGPYAVYVITGPDGKRWEYKSDAGYVAASSMEQDLTNLYGKPIRLGSGGVSWPARAHARWEAKDPAQAGLAILVLGAAWYGICWALGWVIAGFLGDDQQDAKQ
jgi:hypothetical protein